MLGQTLPAEVWDPPGTFTERTEADLEAESTATSPSTKWWRTRGMRARQNAQTWLWKKGVLGTSVPYWSPSLLRGTP